MIPGLATHPTVTTFSPDLSQMAALSRLAKIGPATTGPAAPKAMVGHIDRRGLRDDAASRSWNSSHPSRGPDGGCSQADLRSTGGDGLFYCFAAD